VVNKINDLLSVASGDPVKSVWYSLHVNIPWDRTCKPERASQVFERVGKDGSNIGTILMPLHLTGCNCD